MNDFPTFEIRLRNWLNQVPGAAMTRVEMVSDFLSKRVKTIGLKDSLIVIPNMKIEVMRTLVKSGKRKECVNCTHLRWAQRVPGQSYYQTLYSKMGHQQIKFCTT